MKDFQKYIIRSKSSILSAFQKLDLIPDSLTLFVTNDQDQVIGTVTDGDIRRGFMRGNKLNDIVDLFMSETFHHLKEGTTKLKDIQHIKDIRITLVPLLDSNNRIKDIFNFSKLISILPLDVVIMAGGRGERLRPLTDKTPKPLLKVGSKPIIEHNIDRLIEFGITQFYITIKYLGEQISDYLGDGSKKGINIKYINETIPYGTIGSVSLIKDFQNDHILVMNSDLFTNINFEGFYETFCDQKADMAVATVPYNVNVPYAVLETKDESIISFNEKPTYTYYSNAGIYLIKRELLSHIPIEASFNATDFLQTLIDKKKKIVTYPIVGYWVDIGKLEDYNKVQELSKYL